MLRVVERMFGEGELIPGNGPALKTGYQLVVYRDWQDAAGTLEPRGFVVEGHLLAPPDALEPLVFTKDALVLRLEDGRVLEIYVVSEDGAISGATDQGPQASGWTSA